MSNEEKTNQVPEEQTKKTTQPEQEENLFEKEVEQQKAEDDDLATTALGKPEDAEKPEEESDENEVISTKGFSKKEKISFKREYEKIQLDEEWPEEGKVLTISDVYPQGIKKSDTPTVNDTENDRGYFKKKLMVCFEEARKITVDGEELELKYREPVPSVFYSYDGKAANKIGEPRIPKACEKDDLGDNFTASSAKMRYHFMEAFPDTDAKQSDFDYVEALKGKKVLVKKEVGSWKDGGQKKKFAKLVVAKFVTE